MNLDDQTSLGLTEAAAKEKLFIQGENLIPSEAPKSFLRQVALILSEPMLILLIAAGTINLLLAETLDALMLMMTVFIVLGISIYQSRRAEHALQALKELSAPTVKVIRDGLEKRISSHQVVVGDLVLLSEGDRVCADARVVQQTALSCDESTLTGESFPIAKSPGDSVLSGTLVTSGHAQVIVTATGINSQLGKIGRSLQEISIEKSRLQRDVDQIVRVVGVLGIFTVLSVVLIYGSTRNNWLEGGLAGIAAAMALIPEEFPVILTLFMAIGAWRMSKARVIARQPSAIESLGSISVLCVDKTGTITENRMAVKEVIVNKEILLVDQSSANPTVQELLNTAALACPLHSYDPMDIAFKSLKNDSQERDSLAEFPVTNERLAYIHAWSISNKTVIAAKGAPETIAKLCRIQETENEELMQQVHVAASRGFRVLAIAKSRGGNSADLTEITENQFEFLGLALLQDPIRDGVKESVQVCNAAGIKTVMITGDHPSTALSIGQEIGLNHNAGFLAGADLDKLSDTELNNQIQQVSIFARVRPEHKLRIVRAFQANGMVVGMTGDGVNDAPALRAADIGIAMGGRGTDVAREAASLIITDDNFNSIVKGVERGRVTYSNLQKAMSYVIAIHIPIFGLALLPLFSSAWPLILLPGLVAFHEVIIDPACSVVFEEESADPNIMKEQPRPIKQRIFSRGEILLAVAQGLSVFFSSLVLFLYLMSNARPEQEIRTMIFGTLMLSNIGLILTNRSRTLTILQTFRQRENPTVKWILSLASLIILLLITVAPLRTIFDLGAILPSDWLLMILSSIVPLVWYEIYKSSSIKSVFRQ